MSFFATFQTTQILTCEQINNFRLFFAFNWIFGFNTGWTGISDPSTGFVQFASLISQFTGMCAYRASKNGFYEKSFIVVASV